MSVEGNPILCVLRPRRPTRLDKFKIQPHFQGSSRVQQGLICSGAVKTVDVATCQYHWILVSVEEAGEEPTLDWRVSVCQAGLAGDQLHNKVLASLKYGLSSRSRLFCQVL